jgi:hypothetical protein
MKYFESHPITEYNFFENYFSTPVIDIFRCNFIEIDDVLKTDYIVKQYDNIIDISRQYLDSPESHWILNISNNILFEDEMPEPITEKLLNLQNKNKRKRSYFFIKNLKLKPGDVILKGSQFSSFDSNVHPYSIVYNYDKILRKATIIQPEGSTFLKENDIVVFARKDASGTLSLLTPPGITGITLEKETSFLDSIIEFKKNNIWENPYTNVSGSGITQFAPTVDGTTFEKTLLYSYMTDGNSHSNYIIQTQQLEIIEADNISLKIPKQETIGEIQSGMGNAFSIENSSRVWTINVLRSRLEIP